MEALKLTPRMQKVAAFVPQGAKVADIGCDHAYVSIYLCRERDCRRVIAMDVRPGPLEHARQNIHKAGLEDRITLRLSDGLEMLTRGEVDTVVMAGMGGPLMMELLTRRQELLVDISVLVLQPQSDIAAVRKFLFSIGFVIVEEAMVWDKGKPYFVMRCEHSTQTELSKNNREEAGNGRRPDWTETEFQYGRHLLDAKDAGLYQYLIRQEQQLRQLREKLAGASGDKARERLLEIATQLEYNKAAQAYYEE